MNKIYNEVTVITPAIPTRLDMLKNCIDSVKYQTKQPVAHYVGFDYSKKGCGYTMNRLVAKVETEWIAILQDDDIFYPHHLEVLMNSVDNSSKVIYSWCNVVGRTGDMANWNPNAPYDPERLINQGNYIPVTTLINTEAFREIGGFTENSFIAEDYVLWLTFIKKYGKNVIKNVPIVTWEYRFHGGNHSTQYMPISFEGVTKPEDLK